MTREIIVCKDQQEIFTKAAELFVELAASSIADHANFSVALSGGSTPKGMYALLASDAYRDRVDWSRVHLFWGDERSVAPDHENSNYRMANEAMISKLPIPAENVHRMVAEAADIAAAAAEYEARVRNFFGVEGDGQPSFDLILLGMGDDGHTASLFPGTAALNEQARAVVSNYVEKLSTYRMTLTAPAINNARNVVFMAAGAGKRQPLREVLAGEWNPSVYPSQLIRPAGRLIWLVDEAATGGADYS